MRTRLHTAVALALVLLTLNSCATIRHRLRHLTGDRQVRLADDVLIERDEWGVPHVHGSSDAALAFGVAWAMAEDNYWQIEEAYIQDLGLAAYYYGERFLADDLVRAAFEVVAHARAEYEAAEPPVQELLTGFAEGLNYYLRRHPAEPRRVIARYEPWMILARARRVAAGDTVGSVQLGALAELLGVPGAGWRAGGSRGAGAAVAIAPARSATGQALLLASVHAPFFGSDQPYELEAESGSGWHVYGVARLGTPVPHTGHNEQLAWAHASAPDSAAAVPLHFNHPTDSLAYRVGDGWERATPWTDTVLVNTAAGVERRPYVFLRTSFGPVITRRGDTAWAVQLPGVRQGGSIQQWFRLGRSASLAEFTAALEVGGPPGLATVYADAHGNIMRDWGGSGPGEVNPATGVLSIGVAEAELAGSDSGWSVAMLGRMALGQEARAVAHDVALLVHEWEQVGGRESRRAFALDTVVERLRRWNGRTSPESPEATLYHYWQVEHRAETRAQPGGSTGPTPAPFPRFRALERARARLLEEWGTDSVPWSRVNRLQRRHTSGEQAFRDDAPVAEIAGLPDGSLFVLETVRGPAGRRFAVAGTAAVLVTELKAPPATWSVVTFGQSGAETSPHFFDQAPRYAAGELKETLFGAAARTGRVRERYRPGDRARVLQVETPAR